MICPPHTNYKLLNSFATLAAISQLLRTSLILASNEAPPVISFIFPNKNGVISLPAIFFSLASANA